MTKGGLLLIFVRNLVKGKVKRRLSATVGDDIDGPIVYPKNATWAHAPYYDAISDKKVGGLQ